MQRWWYRCTGNGALSVWTSWNWRWLCEWQQLGWGCRRGRVDTEQHKLVCKHTTSIFCIYVFYCVLKDAEDSLVICVVLCIRTNVASVKWSVKESIHCRTISAIDSKLKESTGGNTCIAEYESFQPVCLDIRIGQTLTPVWKRVGTFEGRIRRIERGCTYVVAE